MKTKIFLIICFLFFSINSLSANYKYKITDRIKINKIDKKISKYILNKKESYFLAKKLKNKIEKILGKTEKQILKNYSDKKTKYTNFKSFALTDIYGRIKITNNSIIKNKVEYLFSNYSQNNILENDYIKIITTNEGFILNNKKLSLTRKDGIVFDYIEFFQLKSKEKTKKYLENNFLNKEGRTKCEIIEYKNNFNKGKSYYFRLQKKYQNKEIYPGSTICPSKFTKGYSNNGINYFQRISTNILIYVNAGQDYIGIDFKNIEIK